MAVLKSTAFKNAVANRTSARTAIGNSKTLIFSGTTPASADTAVTSGLLITLSKNGGAITTNESAAVWTLALTGTTSGSVDTIVLTGHGEGAGISLLTSAVPYNTSLIQTATDVCTAINNKLEIPDFTATNSGTATILITGPIGSGTSLNNMHLTATSTGLTATATAAPTTAGVDPSAGACNYDFSPTAGVITSSETWSGTATAAGTPGFFIRTTDLTETGANTAARRIVGTIGAKGSGADMELDNLSLSIGTPVQLTGSTLTIA